VFEKAKHPGKMEGPTKYYCTLFNSAYLSRGLVLIETLRIHAADFHLYVLALDQRVCEVLRGLALDELTVIPLESFEDSELLKAKSNRTIGEYCWTCTSSLILYCITKFQISHCTYLDADLYFYSDPAILVDEIGVDDVLLTEHRYSRQYDQSATSGIFCVQFLTFRNTLNSLRVLQWWRSACLEWCYARMENGKFGDQKYLDQWPRMFDGIHVMKNLGGGLAPWNIQQYEIPAFERVLRWKGARIAPVFFHFHNLKIYQNGYWKAEGEYLLTSKVRRYFYAPYAKHLFRVERSLKVTLARASVYRSREILSEYLLSVAKGAMNMIRLILGKGISDLLAINRKYHKI